MAARSADGTTFSFPCEVSGGFTEGLEAGRMAWRAAGVVWARTGPRVRIQDGFHHDMRLHLLSLITDGGGRGNVTGAQCLFNIGDLWKAPARSPHRHARGAKMSTQQAEQWPDIPLTARQGYEAMFRFLEQYYELTKADDVGALLGGLRLLPHGGPADPAFKDEWIAAVSAVVGSRI
jgi:hypothetical protein